MRNNRRRYRASELGMLVESISVGQMPIGDKGWHDQRFAYYQTDKALILNPATDDRDYQKIRSLTNVMLDLKNAPNKDSKPVLIPLAEHLGLFGLPLFRRNHWITIHYDPINNTATFIDSRPWYISMFYWGFPMRAQMKEGIKQVYGAEKANTLSIKKCYQGTQDEDISCGAHTFLNIKALGVWGWAISAIRGGTGKDIDDASADNNGIIAKKSAEYYPANGSAKALGLLGGEGAKLTPVAEEGDIDFVKIDSEKQDLPIKTSDPVDNPHSKPPF